LLPKTGLGEILRNQLRDESATTYCVMKR